MTTPIPGLRPSSPNRTSTLLANLAHVTARITAATPSSPSPKPPRLIAVSKLKPASDILTLHTTTSPLHAHFGENYTQELHEKSRLLPSSIKWHFIGTLQSNKCVALARDVRGLFAVESVDSAKKATLLDKGWGERAAELRAQDHEDRLRVFVQVNTSGEDAKSGVPPGTEAVELCRFIRERCPRLRLTGVMTIGAIARSRGVKEGEENVDFLCLRDTRDNVVRELGLQGEEGLELSMGMSEDFEGAIRLGSDEVRVGTGIFGQRPPKELATVL
ncbi:YggS family pyridoxal phosphate enzyme [Aspergillus homomorphus CBS 101889]|uniref:Pyridoxal phosphate homeostasis protein n=1 Tax=Aspergillus homomorphus (strain CBS 101889) TaxID=1450537 RepID=A0A395I042_ASPHC|nr:alanine racemase family protein [Aspergillus homomorphus CBS 101889]RAL13166.1 alanine racemase family protein [Aspergillus homomorphus CBS 101889]